MKYDYDYDPKTNKVITPEGKVNVENFEKDKDVKFWRNVVVYDKLSESFIERFEDKWNLKDINGNILWGYIAWKQKLSEKFIEKYKKKWDLECGNESLLWMCIAWGQELSDYFIEKYKDKWDLKDEYGNTLWYHLAVNQKLSINIILRYYDKVKDYLDGNNKIKEDDKVRMFLEFTKGQ